MLALVSGALALAVPGAAFAIGAIEIEGDALAAAVPSNIATFTPASLDPDLAALVARRGTDNARLMRFTPAGAIQRPDRSVTVAVRVDSETAKAISVRSALAAAKSRPAAAQEVAIAQTKYDLGISRGYQSFAQPVRLPDSVRGDLSMPDLASYRPSGGPADKPSRFGASVALRESSNTGRAPRTAESIGDQSVDVAGSYSVTRNLDVTAGVRVTQERDRLTPAGTAGEQDSQAVYVGTQFRF
jgi:hypothetical protein